MLPMIHFVLNIDCILPTCSMLLVPSQECTFTSLALLFLLHTIFLLCSVWYINVKLSMHKCTVRMCLSANASHSENWVFLFPFMLSYFTQSPFWLKYIWQPHHKLLRELSWLLHVILRNIDTNVTQNNMLQFHFVIVLEIRSWFKRSSTTSVLLVETSLSLKDQSF